MKKTIERVDDDYIIIRSDLADGELPGMRAWLPAPDAEPVFGTDRTQPAMRFVAPTKRTLVQRARDWLRRTFGN